MNALSPSLPDRPFHGLWSLCEMLEFDLPQLIETAKELGRLSRRYSDDTLKDYKFDKDNKAINLRSYENDVKKFEKLDLFMCAVSARLIIRSLDKSLGELVPMLK